jgi:hypothetical protein
MAVARHERPPHLKDATLEEIMERYVGRFRDKVPDWEAFEDAKIEGWKRAQHRTRMRWTRPSSCWTGCSTCSSRTKAASA